MHKITKLQQIINLNKNGGHKTAVILLNMNLIVDISTNNMKIEMILGYNCKILKEKRLLCNIIKRDKRLLKLKDKTQEIIILYQLTKIIMFWNQKMIINIRGKLFRMNFKKILSKI